MTSTEKMVWAAAFAARLEKKENFSDRVRGAADAAEFAHRALFDFRHVNSAAIGNFLARDTFEEMRRSPRRKGEPS